MMKQAMPRKQSPKQWPVRLSVTLAAVLGAMLWAMSWTYQPLVRSAPSINPSLVAAAVGCNTASSRQQLSLGTGVDGDSTSSWPSAMHYTSWQFKGVQMPKIAEGDIDLVPLCNASFVRQYPLTKPDFQRSYIPGSPCSMPPGLLQKIISGQPVQITVVGGSMTQGRRCLDGVRWQRECSWSSRLQDRLRESFPTGNITVHNKAIPGFSYGHWLQSGMLDGLVQADVMVIDEQVNSHQYAFDAYKQMEALDDFLHGVLAAARRQQRHVGLLFVESFRSCFNDQDTCDKSCGNFDQGRQGLFNTTIGGRKAEYRYCSRWWTTADVERPVVRHYQLPTASYRDAAWPHLNKPRHDLPCFWNGRSHPEAISHYIMGDVIAHGLIAALRDSSTTQTTIQDASCAAWKVPTKFHQNLASLQYCTPPTDGAAAPGTFMSAFEPSSFTPLQRGNWLWREDVPGKPGWIHDPSHTPSTTTTPDSNSTSISTLTVQDKPHGLLPSSARPPAINATTIWFNVTFSSKAQLQVTYLTSYSNIGAAELTIHPMSATEKFDNSTALAGYLLNAKINDAVSIPKMAVFVQPAQARSPQVKSMSMVLPEGVGAGSYLVSLRAVEPKIGESHKFKLLGIASC